MARWERHRLRFDKALVSAADNSPGKRRPPTFAPEPWPHPAPSDEWTYWDVSFAVACMVDCGGDWDAFDARLTRERSGGAMQGTYLEPLWSHLLDLRERLAADGLGAAQLAEGAARDPKVIARARSKVWKQALELRAKTAHAVNAESAAVRAGSERGVWPGAVPIGAVHALAAETFTLADGTAPSPDDTRHFLWQWLHPGEALGFLAYRDRRRSTLCLTPTGRAAALTALRARAHSPRTAPWT